LSRKLDECKPLATGAAAVGAMGTMNRQSEVVAGAKGAVSKQSGGGLGGMGVAGAMDAMSKQSEAGLGGMAEGALLPCQTGVSTPFSLQLCHSSVVDVSHGRPVHVETS